MQILLPVLEKKHFSIRGSPWKLKIMFVFFRIVQWDRALNSAVCGVAEGLERLQGHFMETAQKLQEDCRKTAGRLRGD